MVLRLPVVSIGSDGRERDEMNEWFGHHPWADNFSHRTWIFFFKDTWISRVIEDASGRNDAQSRGRPKTSHYLKLMMKSNIIAFQTHSFWPGADREKGSGTPVKPLYYPIPRSEITHGKYIIITTQRKNNYSRKRIYISNSLKQKEKCTCKKFS